MSIRTILVIIAVILVIITVIAVIVTTIYKIVRKVSGYLDTASMVVNSIKEAEIEEESRPRSLQGMDSVLLPRIKKDFPDFNVTEAKTKVKDKMREHLSGKSIKVHDVAIAKYETFGIQKVIVFQISLEYKENEHKVQKRYNLNYTYAMNADEGGEGRVAANCPNCGAVLKYMTSQVCEYCGSAVADVQELMWEFTEIKES